MNKQQAVALLIVLAMTGCTSSRKLMENERVDIVPEQQIPLSRTQSVPQVQVDAASVYEQMIEYYVNNTGKIFLEKPSDQWQTVSRHLEAALLFKPGSTELSPVYGSNRTELERLERELSALLSDEAGRLQAVRITGYASPDGSSRRNEELAVGRALRFRNYLSRKQGIPEQKVIVEQCVEDWNGLVRLTAEGGKPYAAEVARAVTGTTDPDARRKALKAIGKGRAWKDMEQTLFARLRRMELEVVFETKETAVADETEQSSVDLSGLLARFNRHPEGLSQEELLAIAPAFRPGTEQYREVYEQAAYRFPDCVEAQLNAGSAALAAGDTESARFFLKRVEGNEHAWINLGVLALMENDPETAAGWFRKALPVKPGLARKNLELMHVLYLTK